MVRFLIFLVGMLTTNRPGGMGTAPSLGAVRTAARSRPSRSGRPG